MCPRCDTRLTILHIFVDSPKFAATDTRCFPFYLQPDHHVDFLHSRGLPPFFGATVPLLFSDKLCFWPTFRLISLISPS